MNGICPFAEQVKGVTSFSPGNYDRVGFCDHTAGGFLSTMRQASFWNGAGVSTHFAIGRKGEVVQLVNIFDTAFAQGRLGPRVSWPPYQQMGGRNPNSYLISTEHEDAETVNGKTVFVPGAAWTREQYEADLRVKRWCIDEVKRVTGKDLMRFGMDSLAGHYMFDDVNRRNCPGPAWQNEYRARLYADLTQGGDELDAARMDELESQRARAYLIDWLLRDVKVIPVEEDARTLTVEMRAIEDGRVMAKVPIWKRDEVIRGR